MLKRPFLFACLTVWIIAAFCNVVPALCLKISVAAENDREQMLESSQKDSQVQSKMFLAQHSQAPVQRPFTSTTRSTDGSQPSALIQNLENVSGFALKRIATSARHIKNIPNELSLAFNRLTEGKGFPRFAVAVLVIFAIFAAGFGIELFFKRYTTNFYKQIQSIPLMGKIQKFWSALLRLTTEFLGLFIFAIFSLVFFLLIYGPGRTEARLLFFAFLIILLASRFAYTLSDTICSPAVAKLRLLTLTDAAAEYLHRKLVLLACIIASGWVFCRVSLRLGVHRETFLLMIIAVGTIVIALLAVMVWKNRQPVAGAISADAHRDLGGGWLLIQFASIWHLLALAYLFVVWLLWSGQLIIFQTGGRGTFFVSLLIVPIFIVVDRFGQWVVTTIIGESQSNLKQGSIKDAGTEQTAETQAEKGDDRYLSVARRVARTIIFFALLFWLLEIWGLKLSFGKALTKATFDILVTLALAHIFWRIANSFINRKLQESLPAETEDTVQDDGEWGSAASLGRSHTLLPMLRKFIGSVLVTMVIMITLSSIGVDIAPLLAGAGVVGLAIGFGARKLVSDIFSGFFFLVDDAFRVGEYLKAGSNSGRVEKITLRNLFLRHHRGMLQIIPYSDLGPVTNFMRGGLVEKFNLQLPYDTNIDKVRKIIKKVGQKMLADEELGGDFIQPLKSQGVREVGDSVMTFRVKFTAKPGRQFVIRREAIKRITLALEKEGIHYAHRKVIVDLPQANSTALKENGGTTQSADEKSTEKQPDPALLAGGAAALEAIKKEMQEKKTQK